MTRTRRLRLLLPGVGVAAALAAAATVVAGLHGGPQMLYALFFGIALNHLAHWPRTRPGVEFAARSVLRLGVGLLGVRITTDQIVALGWPVVAVVVAAVASTMAVGLLLGRQLKLPRAHSLLAGGAVAICGASAALAIAAVLPRDKDGARTTLLVVVAVTLLSTVAMVLYPLLVRLFDLPPPLAGLFLGGTIHDVAQVVGAGYTVDPATGDAATVIKLFRVTLLSVVVAAIAFVYRQQHADQRASSGRKPARQPLLPWFLWLFVAMVVLNSSLGLAPWLQDGLSALSRGCLVLAIAALGIKTSFAQLARMGWRPVLLIGAETLWLALFVLAAALSLR